VSLLRRAASPDSCGASDAWRHCSVRGLLQVPESPATGEANARTVGWLARLLLTCDLCNGGGFQAGVALLPGGQLLILSPLENDDRRLRCVLVKATHTREPSAAVAQPPHVTTIRVDEPTPASQAQSKPQAQASGALPPSAPEQTGDKRRRGRVRPRTQQEDSADTARPPSPSEAKPPSKVLSGFVGPKAVSLTRTVLQVQATANKAAKPEGQLVLLSSLPRLEKATRIAQLRYVQYSWLALVSC
jgi:hypothetical protein